MFLQWVSFANLSLLLMEEMIVQLFPRFLHCASLVRDIFHQHFHLVSFGYPSFSRQQCSQSTCRPCSPRRRTRQCMGYPVHLAKWILQSFRLYRCILIAEATFKELLRCLKTSLVYNLIFVNCMFQVLSIVLLMLNVYYRHFHLS